jgi:2-polyprenyl-3-methyl-5-hydroxy-6-metoxy-1,4-benzoquinol methylase
MNTNTDLEWETWGKNDPYFGVVTSEKYRSDRLDHNAKREFFKSGEDVVEQVLSNCRKRFGDDFAPKNMLDFGCGVGRLVIPFAGVVDRVVGVDVSDSMLEEAKKNCEINALQNVSFLRSDDNLSLLQESFDFIHSFVVFQHIPTDRGKRIFGKLLSRLNDGGVGAVHMTYAKSYFDRSFGMPPSHSLARRLASAIKHRVKNRLNSHRRTNEIQKQHGSMSRDPQMQMNSYLLNEIFYLIQAAGIRDVYSEFTDHGGHLGVYIYFQKPVLNHLRR